MAMRSLGPVVSEEATLDAFVPDDESAATDVEGDERVADARDTADASPDDAPDSPGSSGLPGDTAGGEAVERAAVTSSWLGDGGTCSACGEPASRLWTADDARICTACKPWTRAGQDRCDQ